MDILKPQDPGIRNSAQRAEATLNPAGSKPAVFLTHKR